MLKKMRKLLHLECSLTLKEHEAQQTSVAHKKIGPPVTHGDEVQRPVAEYCNGVGCRLQIAPSKREFREDWPGALEVDHDLVPIPYSCSFGYTERLVNTPGW